MASKQVVDWVAENKEQVVPQFRGYIGYASRADSSENPEISSNFNFCAARKCNVVGRIIRVRLREEIRIQSSGGIG